MFCGWGGRIRTSGWRNQNPLPYHLATPQNVEIGPLKRRRARRRRDHRASQSPVATSSSLPRELLNSAHVPPRLATSPTAAFRPVDLGPLDVAIEPGRDGIFYARSPFDLGNYEAKATLWLDRWAALRPDHIFLGERRGTRGKQSPTPRRAGKPACSRRLCWNRGLSAERPLAILSGNSVAHALLGLAALYAGIPYAPLSPAYSLASQDFARLRNIVDLLTPGLVFADDGALYARALASLPTEIPRLVCTSPAPGPELLDTFLTTKETSALDRGHATVGPEPSRNSCSPRARPPRQRRSSRRIECFAPIRR